MVQRYAHLSSAHLEQYAQMVERPKVTTGAKVVAISDGYKKAAREEPLTA